MAKTKVEEMVSLGAKRPVDPLNIPLGSEVFDVITGLQGVATQRIEAAGGNIRYGVQPPGSGDSVPESIVLDYHTLLIVGPGCSAVRTPVPKPTSIQVKDRVKEKVSGFEGIVLGKITFLNGCEYLEVHGKATKEKPEGTSCVSQSFLWDKVNDGLNVIEKVVKVVKDKLAKPEDKRPPGGPMARVRPTAAFKG